ncbi:branched-chain amino acid ABC transporter permease [Saccharothrix sp. ST-888]|uniref:branched-chain amino acid ABC transporter permease n=1 Tax=Saccharothrix sp. ST-888 TaxID=1427391 RepID=UPI0005ECA897|nr:branched-chain amino acid ABC transporter permease [Saccharothrix sp. ST-888]KJK57675.1 ABC transporter permease [Saccharothrix sp. ST-888]
MSAVIEQRTERPAKAVSAVVVAGLRRERWYRQPRLRRLGALLAAGLLLAVMTGEQGNGKDLLYSLRGTLASGRLWVCLGLGVVAWVLAETGAPLRAAAVRLLAPVTAPIARGGELAVRRRGVRVTAALVGLALAVFVPLALSRATNQVLVDWVGIYILLALGLNVVIGWAGLLDLGFVAFFAIGGYSAAFWTGHLPVKPPFELNPFLVIPVAMATCLIAGVLLGGPTLRLRGDYLAIVTLGFHEIIYLVAKNSDGLTNGSLGVFGIPHFSVGLGPVQYRWKLDPLDYWWLLLGLIVLAVLVLRRLEHSKVGRTWAAIREDEVAAAAHGVDTVKYKLMAFAIGASTSGAAGVVYASKVGFINPENFPLLYSVLVLAYVIFGGMGSIPGVLLGAGLLAWLPHALKDVVDQKDRFMYMGALLVVMMIYRPQGLLPARRRRRGEPTPARSSVQTGDAQ